MARAHKAWRRAEIIALDTEFMRQTTYYPKLALIQVSDGHSIWLVDPLSIPDLTPLQELCQDPSISKLLHSPSEDLEVFQVSVDTLPQPLIDTQLAAAYCGHALQMSYKNAVAWAVGTELSSSATRSNWLRRPLTPTQRTYAADDVRYLHLIWERLSKQLQESGSMEWFEEDCRAMTDHYDRSGNSDKLYLRVAGHQRLTATELYLLQQLTIWREQTAQELNRARKLFVRDHLLIDLATQQPDSRERLAAINEIPHYLVKYHADALLQLIASALDSGHSIAPPQVLDQRQKQTLKQWQRMTREKADTLGFEPTLLASRRELEAIIRDPACIPRRMRGWRYDVLTKDLLETIDE